MELPTYDELLHLAYKFELESVSSWKSSNDQEFNRRRDRDSSLSENGSLLLVKTETYDGYAKEKESDRESNEHRHQIHPCFDGMKVAEMLKQTEC